MTALYILALYISFHLFQLRVDPVGPAFDLTIPIEIVIGTVPLKHADHQYANLQHGALYRGGSRQPIAVPVLPVQGSFICNPAHASNLSNQASGSQPGSSSRGSVGQQRPSSRSSSAPSTCSSASHSRCKYCSML